MWGWGVDSTGQGPAPPSSWAGKGWTSRKRPASGARPRTSTREAQCQGWGGEGMTGECGECWARGCPEHCLVRGTPPRLRGALGKELGSLGEDARV